MFKSYIKIALRNLNRFKGYAATNIIGLAIGLTCGILIMLFVLDELSYDQFHKNSERIYRVRSGDMETNSWPVGELLRQYPEVEAMIYARGASFLQVMHENKRYSQNIHFAGEEFFKIFSFDLKSGNAQTALKDPFSIVLTEEMALKYFGKSDVVGQTIVLGDSLNFTITGVIHEVPRQSHIQFDMLVSFSTYEKLNTSFSYTSGWGNFNVRNYLLLKEDASASDFEAKVANIYMENVGEFLKQMGMEIYLNLEPLSSIYLESKSGNGWGPRGNIDQVYLVSAIAIFVILLACINFINLTTARSAYRAREVGLRKVVGSSRGALFWQFIAESLVVTIIAFLIVAFIIDLVLPLFNELIGRSYTFNDFHQPQIISGTVILIVIITFLSGYYPAMVLSAYKPAETLKGRVIGSHRGSSLRKGLVVFQFLIASLLVGGTIVVVDQLKFMQEKDPGFEKEQVLIIRAGHIYGDSLQLTSIKNKLKNLASVQSVSINNAFPGNPGWQGQWATPEGFPKDEPYETEFIAVDDEYLETLGIQLIAGRNFDPARISDLKNGLIINETAVKKARWASPEEALGKTITSPSKTPEGIVIGVVRDFHQEGLQKGIWPIVMDYAPQFSSYLAVRFVTGNTEDLVDQVKGIWSTNYPDRDFNYYFLDENFGKQYKAEERLVNVLVVFTILIIIIAVIGLFGLVSFIIVSKTKEIGVRKILGAGTTEITGLLSWQFLKLVLIANAMVIPVAWYLGDRWLENFAYRMELDPSAFILTAVISVGVALLTVGYQTFKAASKNPVDALRME